MKETSDTARRSQGRFLLFAAAAGVVVAGVLLAIAELLALLIAPSASPVLALGSFVIDIVPRWAKELAIAVFGANDKIALLGGIGLAVLVAAALAGVLQLLRPPLGLLLLALAGGLSIAAILTRAGSSALSAVPTLAGTIAAALLMRFLFTRLRRWRAAEAVARSARTPGAEAAAIPSAASPASAGRAGAVDRRGFFRVTVIAAIGAVVIGAGSRIVNAATSSLATVREALRLPSPRTTITVPAGAELDIDGLTPLFTPNADFYRVDTALTVPSVDPSTWSLRITGMVEEEIEISFQQLLDMGLDEYGITLTCVSNEVGGGLVGNARWTGVPLRDVLALARPVSGADMVLSTSVDGYTASTPLSALTDDAIDAILAVSMNGEPLPLEHGFPVRMVVPGLYGYVSATKWVTELKVTTFAADEAYWTPRGYAAEAPIKMSSRIDTPRIDKEIPAGPTKIAGMAWAQTVGIGRVEVSIDDGDWQEAVLSTAVNEDTWVQWYLDWQAETGTHYVAVRAVDAAGTIQIEERAPIAPDGSSGWQRSLVRVA